MGRTAIELSNPISSIDDLISRYSIDSRPTGLKRTQGSRSRSVVMSANWSFIYSQSWCETCLVPILSRGQKGEAKSKKMEIFWKKFSCQNLAIFWHKRLVQVYNRIETVLVSEWRNEGRAMLHYAIYSFLCFCPLAL